MKCISKNCKREMTKRSGKFGIFYYCPDHGTISEKVIELLAQIKEKSKEVNYNDKVENYRDVLNNDPLIAAIEKQTLAFGVQIPELVKFGIDHNVHFPNSELDTEDDWTLMRPY